MKRIIDGRTYNTDTMTELANCDAYDSRNNYTGSDMICVTPGGRYAYVTTSSGQDWGREPYIHAIDKSEITKYIDGWTLTNAEIKALTALGIVQEA